MIAVNNVVVMIWFDDDEGEDMSLLLRLESCTWRTGHPLRFCGSSGLGPH